MRLEGLSGGKEWSGAPWRIREARFRKPVWWGDVASPYLVRQGLILILELTTSLNLLANKPQAISRLHIPSARVTRNACSGFHIARRCYAGCWGGVGGGGEYTNDFFSAPDPACFSLDLSSKMCPQVQQCKDYYGMDGCSMTGFEACCIGESSCVVLEYCFKKK